MHASALLHMVLCCFVPAKVYQSALLICIGLVYQHRLHQCPALSAAMYGLTVSEVLRAPLLGLVQIMHQRHMAALILKPTLKSMACIALS